MLGNDCGRLPTGQHRSCGATGPATRKPPREPAPWGYVKLYWYEMGHAGGAADAACAVEFRESGIAVGVHPTFEVGEASARFRLARPVPGRHRRPVWLQGQVRPDIADFDFQPFGVEPEVNTSAASVAGVPHE